MPYRADEIARRIAQNYGHVAMDERLKVGLAADIAAALRSYGEMLHELLRGRDQFIVDRGLWPEFVEFITSQDKTT